MTEPVRDEPGGCYICHERPHRHRDDLAAALLAALFCALCIASVLVIIVLMWYDLLVIITQP